MANDAFKFSGEAAANYDQYLGPLMFEPYAVDLVKKIDPAGVTSVLEVACGTGRVTRHLRNYLAPGVKLVASDVNPDMLKVAQSKIDSTNIEFRIEDLQQLSFPDNSFNVVVCQFGLMFLKDKMQGLKEALRVLKPGGTFIFSTWDSTKNIPLHRLIFNDIILPFFDGEDTARFLVPFSLFDAAIHTRWMEEAGFEKVSVNKVTLRSTVSSPNDVVKAMFTKHSLGAEVMSKDPGAYETMAHQIRDQVAAKFGDTDPVFELSAFITVGRKG